MADVLEHEPKLFRIAFRDAFDAPGEPPDAVSEVYAHAIMSKGRWLTLSERETFNDLVQTEVWEAHQAIAKTVIHSQAWRRKYGYSQQA